MTYETGDKHLDLEKIKQDITHDVTETTELTYVAANKEPCKIIKISFEPLYPERA